MVALLQPEDEAKLDALIANSPEGEQPVTAQIEDWTVLATDQATLDRFQAAQDGDALADSDAFKDAMDGLAEDALVRAYVDLPALTQAAAAETDAPLGDLERLFEASPLGLATSAEDDGFRLEAGTKTSYEAENFEPELPSQLPAGALLYAGFGDVATAIREALNAAGEANPELDQQIAQLELVLGVSLDEDVLPLVEEETAITVYPAAAGAELPSVLLTMRVDDEAAAVANVDQVLERASEFSPEVPQPTPTDIDGVEVREVALPDGVTIVYGGLDGKLFATNDPALVSQLAGDGAKLSDDEDYTRAREAADMPGEIQGVFYVNLNDGADYVFQLAEASGEAVPGPVRDNVEPLDSLLLYGTQDGDRVRVSGFLALD